MANTLGGLLRNASFSIAADLLNRAANTLLFILISRSLGVTAAGVFGLAVTYFLIASRFSFWGLGQLLTREVARRRNDAGRYLVNFVALRLLLAIAAIAGVITVSSILPYGQQTRAVVLIVSLSILPENISDICRALFMAFERMSYLTVVAVSSGTVKLALGALLLRSGAGVEAMAVVFTLASGLTMVLNLLLATSRFARPRWRLDWTFCASQLRVAFPFVFIGVLLITDNRIDVVLLSVLRDEHAVGLYTAAMTIVTALALLPEGFRTAVYPILARYQARSHRATVEIYARSFKYLLLLAMPMTLGTALLADEAINLVYRSAFQPAAPVLQIGIWSLVAYSLTVLNSRLLIVHNRQDLVAWFLLGSSSTTVVLNLLLVPVAGPVGAALAKVVSAFVLFVLSQWGAMRLLGGFSPWPFIGRPLIAAALMAGVVVVLTPWGLPIQIAAGVIAYVGVLAALRTFPPEEQVLWRRALIQRSPLEASDDQHNS